MTKLKFRLDAGVLVSPSGKWSFDFLCVLNQLLQSSIPAAETLTFCHDVPRVRACTCAGANAA